MTPWSKFVYFCRECCEESIFEVSKIGQFGSTPRCKNIVHLALLQQILCSRSVLNHSCIHTHVEIESDHHFFDLHILSIFYKLACFRSHGPTKADEHSRMGDRARPCEETGSPTMSDSCRMIQRANYRRTPARPKRGTSVSIFGVFSDNGSKYMIIQYVFCVPCVPQRHCGLKGLAFQGLRPLFGPNAGLEAGRVGRLSWLLAASVV